MTPIKSYQNRHGRTVHYDEAGHKIGESYRSPSGGRVIHYDASGREVGRSYGNPSGRMTHYDSDGNRLVGIISHVADLKEKIDKQVIITKEKAGGSKIEISV